MVYSYIIGCGFPVSYTHLDVYKRQPYSGFWDSMHWGHAISEDMLHWEYLPPALAPSEVYDDHPKGGCFSGSAIEHDNKLFLLSLIHI